MNIKQITINRITNMWAKKWLMFTLCLLLVFLTFTTLSAEEKVNYKLEIKVVGGGSTSPSPGTYYHPKDSTVFINAIPNADWAFDHWEGDISGTSLYTQVYMNAPKTITAVFSPAQWRLTLTHSGDANGTTFPGPGVYVFLNGQDFTINSATSDGVYFGGWTVNGTSVITDESIQIIMDSDKQMDARFTSTGHYLNVFVVGKGGAKPGPEGNPHRFSSDISVHVTTFQTDPLWRFEHWEGDIGLNEPGSYTLFNLSMDQDREITAYFIEKPYYPLTIEVIGEGNVSLREGFNDPIILTPGVYLYSYLEWTYIRCESIETTTDWKFLRWEGDFGDTSPTYPRCAFSMDKERHIRCIFTDKTQIPNVVGISQSNANTAITNAWLTVGDITQECNDEYPAGYVINQAPPAGTTVDIGTSVALWISTGPCPVPVPNVIGMTSEGAQNTITSARLTLGSITQQCNNQIQAGIVINQSPPAEELVSPGSRVNLIVSSGPCPVPVPNIMWQSRSNAETMIANAGLTVGIVTEQCHDTVPANRVINQYPPANQQVSPGTAVNFTVSSGPCFATVPNVVSYTQSIAENLITTAGLVIGEVSQQCHPSIRAGIVISQTPSAGTQVSYGTAVSLVISTGPCPVIVPDVVIMPRDLAETTITNAGLTVGRITQQCSDTIPSGIVISQTPSAGTQVNAGTKVNLVISTGSCTEGSSEGTEGEGTIEGTLEGAIEGIVEGEGMIEGQNDGALEGEGTYEGFEGEPEEGEKPTHSADPNGDRKINLSELLRVIQFFNHGSYHCETGTEDEYAPGIGDTGCTPHSSDYNPQDWTINLSELLRLIQFFNSGGYHPCPDGEDGFCPGL